MIEWILFLILGTAFTVSVAAVALPKLVFRAYACGFRQTDRGVEKYNLPHGNVVVAEPLPAYRNVLRQYLLVREKEAVFFLGKWDREILFVDYDLVIFDARGKVLSVLNVKQLLKPGYRLQKVALPIGACSVSVLLNAVDDRKYKQVYPAPQRAFFLYSGAIVALAAALAAFQAFLFETAFSHLFSEDAGRFLLLPRAGGVFALAAVGAVLVMSAAVFFGLWLKRVLVPAWVATFGRWCKRLVLRVRDKIRAWLAAAKEYALLPLENAVLGVLHGKTAGKAADFVLKMRLKAERALFAAVKKLRSVFRKRKEEESAAS